MFILCFSLFSFSFQLTEQRYLREKQKCDFRKKTALEIIRTLDWYRQIVSNQGELAMNNSRNQFWRISDWHRQRNDRNVISLHFCAPWSNSINCGIPFWYFPWSSSEYRTVSIVFRARVNHLGYIWSGTWRRITSTMIKNEAASKE